MHNYCINKLLNIEDVIVKKVEHADTFVKIYLETIPKEQICPFCHAVTKRIHDYRSQIIKDLPFQFKHCYLILKKDAIIVVVENIFMNRILFYPNIFTEQTDSRLISLLSYIRIKVLKMLLYRPMFLPQL